MGESSSKLPGTLPDDVDSMIRSNCVVIFSKTTCSYSKMAKRVFENIGVPYTAIELNRLENGAEIQKILASMTGATTVSVSICSFANKFCVNTYM